MKLFSSDSFVRLTRQYVGGTIAGLGLGLMIGVQVAGAPIRLPFIVPLGLVLIAIGSLTAKAGQTREREVV